jgi:outer membrane protein TolC
VSRTFSWFVVLALVAAPSSTLAGAPEGASAVERLRAAVRSAWERSPSLAASRASIAMTLAETEASAVAEGPYLQLQAEGIGSSFDEKPNAARYLRVGKPFSWPGQVRAGRRLVEQGESWSGAALEQVRLELAGRVADAWLQLAAQQESVAVVARVADRLGDAVEAQREKLELGEVSGSELLQLELEHVDAEARLAEARVGLTGMRQALVRLAGEEAASPRRGDLAELVRVLAAAPGNPCADRSPAALTARAEQRAELARRNADLVARTKWGRPAAEVEWEAIPDVDGAEGFDALGLTLELPLPLGRSGKLSQVRADAEARQAEAELAQIRLAVDETCHAALARVRAGRAQLDVLRAMEGRLEDAEIALAGQFRLGEISYLTYIDGVNRLEDVRLRGIGARSEYLAGRARLAALLGREGLFPLPETTAQYAR